MEGVAKEGRQSRSQKKSRKALLCKELVLETGHQLNFFAGRQRLWNRVFNDSFWPSDARFARRHSRRVRTDHRRVTNAGCGKVGMPFSGQVGGRAILAVFRSCGDHATSVS
jgi:hypothetical protein